MIRMWGLSSVLASSGNEEDKHQERTATILTLTKRKKSKIYIYCTIKSVLQK